MPLTGDLLALTRQKISDLGTNAQQNLEIDNATGGTFTITFNGQTTIPLAYNAGGNVLQNALAALSNIGIGNVVVNEQPGLPGAILYAIYFVEQLGRLALPMITVDGSLLTGIGVLVNVSLAQAGGVTAFSDDELSANYDLAQQNFWLGCAYDIDDLWVNTARFNRYIAGQSTEFKEQIFDHFEKMQQFFHQWANADRQVQTSRLQLEPPRLRAVPRLVGTTATSLNYGRPYGPWPWNKGGW